jgi:hypothetical protein
MCHCINFESFSRRLAAVNLSAPLPALRFAPQIHVPGGQSLVLFASW